MNGHFEAYLERSDYGSVAEKTAHANAALIAAAPQLAAENARLRAALELIARGKGQPQRPLNIILAMQFIARVALAGEQPA